MNRKIKFPDLYTFYKTDNHLGKGLRVQMKEKQCEIEMEYIEEE